MLENKVRTILSVNLCSMNEKDYSEKIKIFKPYETIRIEKEFTYDELKTLSIKEFISCCNIEIEEKENKLQEYNMVYIQKEDVSYLLGIPKDKVLYEILKELELNEISLVSFLVKGGASIHLESMLLQIYTNENVHHIKSTPHVHVNISGQVVRYTICDSPDIYRNDKLPKEHITKQKEIKKNIKKNKEELLKMWYDYKTGYITPKIDEYGNSYYIES